MENPHYIPSIDHQPVQLMQSHGLRQWSPPPIYQPPAITQQPGIQKPREEVHLQPTTVTQQRTVHPAPGSVWMPLPPTIPGVPRGLEYLSVLEVVQIYQITESLEIVTGWDTKNKYVLKNANGEQCYYAFEESDSCDRQCCGAQRAFVMHIADNFGREVLIIDREYAYCAGGYGGCCAWAAGCQQACTVGTPSTGPLGHIRQRMGCMSPNLDVFDKSGQLVFEVDGPDCCAALGCADQEFEIRTTGRGETIGAITKMWGGFLREAFTNADTFLVNFPKDLDVQLKGVLLGATFLIDFMAFERDHN